MSGVAVVLAAIGSAAIVALVVGFVLVVTTCDSEAQVERFIVATGSSLDHEVVREACREADYFITGQYGWSKRCAGDSVLASKAIVYFDMLTFPSYEGDPQYDLQPSPYAMGHEYMPLTWGWGFGSCAYDMRDEAWPTIWLNFVVRFLKTTNAAGVLLDNWHVEHEWWTNMLAEHYAAVHVDKLPGIMHDVEHKIVPYMPGRVILLNGPSLTSVPHRRFWESFGWRGTWNTLGIWRSAQAGDFIYCSTGGDWYWLAEIVGSMRDCPVGLGNPDGVSLVDDEGELAIDWPRD